MFTVLGLIFCGIFAGYILRKVSCLQHLSKGISITIYLLLFFLGISVGANNEVISNLLTLGGNALFISTMAVAGSCIAAKFVYMLFFKREKGVGEEKGFGVGEFKGRESRESVGEEEGVSFGVGVEKGNENVGGSAMMGSIKVVVFFILGALLGYLLLNYATLPAPLANGSVTQWVLYLLMIQVGASIGSDKNLKEILKAIRPKMLLIPLGTIVGTLIFTAIAALFISKWGFFDSMAIGSGFAYYSLSSILITQLTEPSVGIQMATQLGTVALLANILREIYGLLGAPLFYRYFGIFAPICVGGATTMDTTLPIITSVCGKNLAFISIFHGILVDFSVPLLVSFFCSI